MGGTSNAMVATGNSFVSGYYWNLEEAGARPDLGGTPTNVNVIALRINSGTSMNVWMNGGTAKNFDPNAGVVAGARGSSPSEPTDSSRTQATTTSGSHRL